MLEDSGAEVELERLRRQFGGNRTALLRRLEQFRFTEYHEPVRRWPFLETATPEPIRRRMAAHGALPPLLTDDAATKGAIYSVSARLHTDVIYSGIVHTVFKSNGKSLSYG